MFQYIKENKVWIGFNLLKKFKQPNGTLKDFGNICWFTNLNNEKRNDKLVLTKKYKGNEKDYPKYDNYDAINVDKIKDIPMDYDGPIGVPITYIDKYNPNQFEILGLDDHRVIYPKLAGCNSINGKKIYRRLIVKNLFFN
jgi:hypothetical protein